MSMSVLDLYHYLGDRLDDGRLDGSALVLIDAGSLDAPLSVGVDPDGDLVFVARGDDYGAV